MAGGGKRFPGDVQPAVAGQELVGKLVGFQEFYQPMELGGVFGADIRSLTLKMLRVLHSTYTAVHIGITETGVDDDGTANSLTGRLKQISTTIHHI